MSASDKIARLREVRAKATAGPWSTIKDKSPYWIVNKNGDAELGTFAVARDVWWEANAAAIVAAMNSLDALLECAEALEAMLVWHEERDKALSKQPPNTDVNWRRMEHREQIDKARAALDALSKDTP